MIRFARYVRAEDTPPRAASSRSGCRDETPRPVPYIFLPASDIQRLMHSRVRSGYRTLRRATYSTLFGLLACTGLRLSEAIHLRYADITQDGLVIRRTKFRKSRLVPLHDTARAALDRYLEQRRPYARLDDHVFISLRRKPLLVARCGARISDRRAQDRLADANPAGQSPPLHAIRHTFAVRALEACPDERDCITKHMVALSTYLGHGHVGHTYWYLEADPAADARINVERCERFIAGGSQ